MFKIFTDNGLHVFVENYFLYLKASIRRGEH